MRKSFKNSLPITLLALLASGCGKEGFETINSVSQQQAPGHFTIAPKVDILLAQDNTGSMSETFDEVARQIPGFLNELESAGWDYHFASTPLTGSGSAFSEVVASRHDSNWALSLWQTPFPGAVYGDTNAGSVNQDFFRFPSEYSEILNYNQVSNTMNGQEAGLENIRRALTDNVTTASGFLRQDSMLVVLVMGNGNDTSGIKICRRSDGYQGPCDDIGYPSASNSITASHCGTPGVSYANCNPGSFAAARDHYKARLEALRAHPSLVKLYAAVSTQGGNCLGSSSYRGSQYMSVAQATGGKSFNICNQGVSNLLSSVKNELQGQKIAFRTRYLMIEQAPDVATVQVVRQRNGNANDTEVIPQDAINGWTYAGLVDNIHRIDFPIEMNLASGFAIELHGSAKLIGNDTARVTFKPAR